MGNSCSNTCGDFEEVSRSRNVTEWERKDQHPGGFKPLMMAGLSPANAELYWNQEEQAHEFNSDNGVAIQGSSPLGWNHYDREAATGIGQTYKIVYGLANEVVLEAGGSPKAQEDMSMFHIQRLERQRTNAEMDDLYNAKVQAYMQQPDKDGKIRDRILDYTTYNVDDKKDLIMYRRTSMVSIDTSDHFDFIERFDTEGLS